MFDLIPFAHPSNGVLNYLDEMNRAFFGNAGAETAPCSIDMIDQESQYMVRIDLPGFKKEEIHIDREGDRLTVSAQHSEACKESGAYIRRERPYGPLSRSFDVSSIEASRIQAKYENGVLELTLPKKGAAAPNQRITIE